MNLFARVAFVVAAGVAGAIAQSAPAPAVTNQIDNAFVQKEFGPSCTALPDSHPIVADLNNDGIADLVIPAHCKNPMMDQSEFNFVAVDPYDTFFGYGNTKITSGFASEDPDRKGYVLLVIHGNGPQAWRSETPQAKFLIINLPFREITVKRLSLKKKKTVAAICAVETGADEMNSATFWDGKRYRYVPLGSGME